MVSDGLSPQQIEQLRQMLQPLVAEFKISRATVVGFLAGAGVPAASIRIDPVTGMVTVTVAHSGVLAPGQQQMAEAGEAGQER